MSQRDRLLAAVDADLEQDCSEYRALRGLMGELYERLLERDCAGIERINLQITLHVEAIALRAQRRSKVLGAFSLQADTDGMRRLLASATGTLSQSLQQHWQQVGELTVQCRQLNERNGKLLAMHHDILQQLLAGNQDARLYVPQAY